jgi:transcriptional regulator
VSIYVPEHFRGDEAAGRRLIAEHPFATLMTVAAGGAMHVSHLPLLLPDDGGAVLVGHLARANPHASVLAGAPSVAVFHGPHAFVSRGWYSSPADNVPTWNYATVHVTGTPRLCDAAASRAALQRLEARFEPPSLPPIAPDRFERLLPAIVAFEMPVERLEVKLKLSQNKAAPERARLAAGLRETRREESVAVADWMARLP